MRFYQVCAQSQRGRGEEVVTQHKVLAIRRFIAVQFRCKWLIVQAAAECGGRSGKEFVRAIVADGEMYDSQGPVRLYGRREIYDAREEAVGFRDAERQNNGRLVLSVERPDLSLRGAWTALRSRAVCAFLFVSSSEGNTGSFCFPKIG
jgi:hypothetical protein